MPDTTIPAFSFPAVGRKKITADFDGGQLTSNGGVMLLAMAERRLGVSKRLAVDFHSEVTRSACYCHGGLTHVLIWMPSVMRLTHYYHIVETGNDIFWLKTAGAVIIERKKNS